MQLLTKLVAVIDCGSLGNPENGMVSVSTTTYNSVANYSCNTGYNLTGEMSRTCLDTGLWSGSEPTCTGKTQHSLKIDLFTNNYFHFISN